MQKQIWLFDAKFVGRVRFEGQNKTVHETISTSYNSFNFDWLKLRLIKHANIISLIYITKLFV